MYQAVLHGYNLSFHVSHQVFVPDLVRGSSKADPAVVERDDKLALVQLHVDLASSKQHQWVDRHHAAVPDEHPARLHLLVVDKVGAGVVARLLAQKNCVSK